MREARWFAILVIVFVFWSPLEAQDRPKPFTPEDMLGIVEFVPGSEPATSPDGSWVAYAITDTSRESNILASHPDGFLWISKVGAKPMRIGDSDYADTPVWSPDGRQLAFFRTEHGRRQLCIWSAASQKIRQLGDTFPKDQSLWPSDELAPQWSADNTVIVYPVLMPVPGHPEPESQLLHSTDAVMPFDVPFIDTREWTLVATDVNTGRITLLTPQPISLQRFSLSPDGKNVLFRAITPDSLKLFRQQCSQDWLVPIDGSQKPQAILAGRSPAWVIFSANGNGLLFPEKGVLLSISTSGTNEKALIENFPQKTQDPHLTSGNWLAVLAARPGTGPTDSKMYSIIEPTWDVAVAKVSTGNVEILTQNDDQTQNDDVAWSGDGSTLFYHSVNEKTYGETVRSWQPGNSHAKDIYSADQSVRGLSPTHDGLEVVFTAMSATSPEDGYEIESGKSASHRLTDLNPQLAAFHFQPPRLFHFYSADGDLLEGLLYLPPGTDPAHRVPVVTYVYEKLSPFKNRFDAEAQWYVSHGYGYLMPDVLVKPGFLTEAYVKSVIPAVNSVRAMEVSTGRFGITGGSLGGFAGLSLITHSDIFAAAVLRAPPSDFFSTWGDGRDRDIWTIESGQGRADGTPWNRRDGYIENSPFFEADRVHTPVLIVHGEADFTVPFQQGLMMFSALRALHRTADLLIYRDAEHSIVRGSRFRFLDFHAHTMEWWERYLIGNLPAKDAPGAKSIGKN